MADEIAARLVASFESTGASDLLSTYKKIHKATIDLGDAMDAVAGKQHGFWRAFSMPAGALDDLKAAHTAIKDMHTLLNQHAPTQFTDGLQNGIKQSESLWDRFTDKVKNWRPDVKFNWNDANLNLGLGSLNVGGPLGAAMNLAGGALTLPINIVTSVGGAALGAVGSVAGAGLGLVGGAAGMAGGAAGAAAGFGLDQLTSGLSDVASLDAARASVAAHMGTDFSKLPKAERDKRLKQIMDNAFLLSSAPETGKVDSMEALAAMDEAAKAGITDPTAMMNMAKTALQLRAAGGENKITTSDSMKLLITGKNAFGGKYTDLQVANGINGLVNATTLDINQIQGILKNAGSAATTGMDLNQYLLEAGIFAQAGVNVGQIGGGIKQILQMSQPRSDSSIAAMEKLGLVSKGKNRLWDDDGTIKDPEAFFKQVLAGTKGMDPQEISDLVGKAFNPKAAGYVEQTLNYYKGNPQAFTDLESQMQQQSDVAATAATQNDNLSTSLRNLGDTLQNVKDQALLPFTEPLKDLANGLTTLGQDVMKGDWGAFNIDLGALKTMVINQLQGVKQWFESGEPQRILMGAKSEAINIVKILFGDGIAGKVQSFFDTDLPAAFNGVKDFGKGIVNFWDTKLRPILFGTPEERTAALTDLGKGIGDWLSGGGKGGGGLPGLISANKKTLVDIGTQIGGPLVDGFWQGFKKGDIGQALDALLNGDFATFVDLLKKHGGGGTSEGTKEYSGAYGPKGDKGPSNPLDDFNKQVGGVEEVGKGAAEKARQGLGLDKPGPDGVGKGPNSNETTFNKDPGNYTANPFDPDSWNPLTAVVKAVGRASAAVAGGAYTDNAMSATHPPDAMPLISGQSAAAQAAALTAQWRAKGFKGHYVFDRGHLMWVADPPQARAFGGPVNAGESYIVGDGGRPELFIPQTNGHILPQVPTGGAPPVIQVLIQTYAGDTNKYSVPTVAQRHSQDAEYYGRLSRPGS